MAVGRASTVWAVGWRVLAVLAAVLLVRRLTAPDACLPSLDEQGRRLHEMPAPGVLWLEPLLRQHEACWTAGGPHDELRVFVYGNSAVQGHPLRADDIATEFLNRYWKEMGVPARAFNFGFVSAHALKDMFIVHESLRYRPDVIVYGTYPVDFTRFILVRARDAPRGSLEPMIRFMRNSAGTLRAFAAEHPAGLERPLELYGRALAHVERRWSKPLTWPVGEITAFVRTAIATRVRPLGERLGLREPLGEPTSGAPIGPYDCRAVHKSNARSFRQWGDVNSLAYLAEVRDRLGVPVVVVMWPISHEPSADCFNAYVTKRIVDRYRMWMRAEAARLRLPLIDLTQTLLPRDFLDTLHPNARGQRKIAGTLSPQLVPILRARAAEVLPAAPH